MLMLGQVWSFSGMFKFELIPPRNPLRQTALQIFPGVGVVRRMLRWNKGGRWLCREWIGAI
ncbi:hypothetical protein, partial [Caballeronia sp.]|uniref:hypothetical protein n=1 Tax=Caballeronia sp. TaxID=1931223 RepID=UPI003C497791